MQTGREAEAREETRLAVDTVGSAPCDADDRALAHARLSQLFEAFGEPEKAAEHRAAGLRDHAAFREEQAELLGLLDGALGDLVPA